MNVPVWNSSIACSSSWRGVLTMGAPQAAGSPAGFAAGEGGRTGEGVGVTPPSAPLRSLLISGNPTREPVAWWGPIVMNSRHELEHAIEEFQTGTFIKHGKSRGIPT